MRLLSHGAAPWSIRQSNSDSSATLRPMQPVAALSGNLLRSKATSAKRAALEEKIALRFRTLVRARGLRKYQMILNREGCPHEIPCRRIAVGNGDHRAVFCQRPEEAIRSLRLRDMLQPMSKIHRWNRRKLRCVLYERVIRATRVRRVQIDACRSGPIFSSAAFRRRPAGARTSNPIDKRRALTKHRSRRQPHAKERTPVQARCGCDR